MDEAEALCDRIAIIDGGRIVAQGTADELKAAVHGEAGARSSGDANRGLHGVYGARLGGRRAEDEEDDDE